MAGLCSRIRLHQTLNGYNSKKLNNYLSSSRPSNLLNLFSCGYPFWYWWNHWRRDVRLLFFKATFPCPKNFAPPFFSPFSFSLKMKATFIIVILFLLSNNKQKRQGVRNWDIVIRSPLYMTNGHMDQDKYMYHYTTEIQLWNIQEISQSGQVNRGGCQTHEMFHEFCIPLQTSPQLFTIPKFVLRKRCS